MPWLVHAEERIGKAARKRIKRKLYRISQHCHYCGIWLDFHDATIDHREPRVYGGSNSLKNLACACEACNKEKRDKPYAFFVAHVQQQRSAQIKGPTP